MKQIRDGGHLSCCPERKMVHFLPFISRLTAELEAQKWRLIDTAPKDGSRILVFSPAPSPGYRQHVAWWNDDRYNRKPRPFWEFETTMGIAWTRTAQPTHWRPLPEEPALATPAVSEPAP